MADIAADADNVLRIGSGDDLAASVMSSAFDGRHVVDAFDAGGLDHHMFGNHDIWCLRRGDKLPADRRTTARHARRKCPGRAYHPRT